MRRLTRSLKILIKLNEARRLAARRDLGAKKTVRSLEAAVEGVWNARQVDAARDDDEFGHGVVFGVASELSEEVVEGSADLHLDGDRPDHEVWPVIAREGVLPHERDLMLVEEPGERFLEHGLGRRGKALRFEQHG
jgi:hypothetical protein